MCGAGETECADGYGCVKTSQMCDGQAQCADGSDERNCTQNRGCMPGDWTCRNKLCIPIELRCNGRNDCVDDSDEEACGEWHRVFFKQTNKKIATIVCEGDLLGAQEQTHLRKPRT